MLGVGGAAAVAADQKLAPPAPTREYGLSQFVDRGAMRLVEASEDRLQFTDGGGKPIGSQIPIVHLKVSEQLDIRLDRIERLEPAR